MAEKQNRDGGSRKAPPSPPEKQRTQAQDPPRPARRFAMLDRLRGHDRQERSR